MKIKLDFTTAQGCVSVLPEKKFDHAPLKISREKMCPQFFSMEQRKLSRIIGKKNLLEELLVLERTYWKNYWQKQKNLLEKLRQRCKVAADLSQIFCHR